MTKVIIAGAKGKMGQALLRVAGTLPSVMVAGRLERGQDLGGMIQGADVVIDFTYHDATASFARLCAEHKKAIVVGTTGHTDGQRKELVQIALQTPMVWASNFSTGVNTLFWLAGKAVKILGPDYDLEIVEMHHRLKKDAPSGTADTLARILAEARQLEFAKVVQHGREGLTGARTAAEIGMHSLRGGDVVGDHTVIFATNGERVELTHKASSRDTFAGGALRAAQWVVGKPPGLYDMQDVLGLK
jgi:4-hydroxy-tetrahydrodipicolinate reductase